MSAALDDLAGSGRPAGRFSRERPRHRLRGRTPDSVTAAAVAACLVWALVPIAALALHTLRYGGVLSGTDGPLAGSDQLFYMDSIRQSGQHLLIADHFDLVIGRAVFLHPLYLLGGLLWRLGAGIQASFWLLQLLGAVVLALGAAQLARASLRGGGRRAAALALGLFYLSPLLPLLAWTRLISPFTRFQTDFPAGESMPAWQVWGYPHACVAVGLLALALLGVARVATPGKRGRWTLPGVTMAALLLSWLHPWQGAIFVAVTAVVALQARSWPITRRLSVPVLGAILPAVYEQILVHQDAAWRLDSSANAVGTGPLWMLALALAPLALAALPGLRALPRGPLGTILVAWPLSALVVYFAVRQFPYHALEGIAIPLAVVAVRGWPGAPSRAPGAPSRAPGAPRGLRVGEGRPQAVWSGRRSRSWRLAGASLVTLAAASGVAYEIGTLRDGIRSGVAPYWMSAGERRALAYLDRAPAPGGVLASFRLGMAVPAFTGRRSWIGHWAWTPDFSRRQSLAAQLMDGALPPAAAQALVRGSGARFVLADCRSRPGLRTELAPLLSATRSFGCATVYELAPPPRSATAARPRSGRETRPG